MDEIKIKDSKIHTGFFDMVYNGLSDKEVFNVMDFGDNSDEIKLNMTMSSAKHKIISYAPVSAFSFTVGYCGYLAEAMADKYSMGIGVIYSSEGDILHVYNVINDKDLGPLYVDNRGVTDSSELLGRYFEDMDCYFLEFDSVSAAKECEDFTWHFESDEISDSMVAWFMNKYEKNYEILEKCKPITKTLKSDLKSEIASYVNSLKIECSRCEQWNSGEMVGQAFAYDNVIEKLEELINKY